MSMLATFNSNNLYQDIKKRDNISYRFFSSNNAMCTKLNLIRTISNFLLFYCRLLNFTFIKNVDFSFINRWSNVNHFNWYALPIIQHRMKQFDTNAITIRSYQSLNLMQELAESEDSVSMNLIKRSWVFDSLSLSRKDINKTIPIFDTE